MSNVLVGIEPVEESLYNVAVPSGPTPHHPLGPSATSRLSPFHMPRTVEIEVNSRDECTFRFVYANDEPAERGARKVSPQVEALLGKNSRKLLELRISAARAFLQVRQPIFVATAATAWVDEVPWHSRFACLRNAEVVARLMDAMPDDLRHKLLGHLSELCGPA